MLYRAFKINPKFLIFIPVILAIFVVTLNINKPFIGHHDFMSAFEGQIARNYLNFGVWDLKFGQVTGIITKDQIRSNKSFQTSYLPLLPLLIYFSYLVFGISEWATRLVPAIFSIVGMVFLYLICQKLWNNRTALFACLFYILNPMFIYFSKLPAPEPLIVGLVSVVLYYYLIYLDVPSTFNLNRLFLLIFFTGFIGWPILYICPLIILHSLYIKKFSRHLLFLLVPLFIIPSLQFLHVYILTGDMGGGLLNTLIRRTSESNLSFGGSDFNFINYIRQEISWLQVYYTRVALILSLIYAVTLIRHKIKTKDSFVLLLLFFGLSHIVLFSKYVFVHDFLNMYLLPFVALSSALALNKIFEFLIQKRINFFTRHYFVILLFLVLIFERIAYTKALLETSMNKTGLDMAVFLNSIQTSPNQAIIISPRFISFYGVFTNFYSIYPYGVSTEEEIIKNNTFLKYKYIIIIDQDITNPVFYKYLTSNYKFNKQNDWTIINTYETK